MSANQLWETTMNPEARTLIQVRIEGAELAEHRVTTLMSSKVEPRWERTEENIQFTLIDDQGSDKLVKNKGQLPQTKEPTIDTRSK